MNVIYESDISPDKFANSTHENSPLPKNQFSYRQSHYPLQQIGSGQTPLFQIPTKRDSNVSQLLTYLNSQQSLNKFQQLKSRVSTEFNLPQQTTQTSQNQIKQGLSKQQTLLSKKRKSNSVLNLKSQKELSKNDQFKLFQTPSYTRKDIFMNAVIANKDLQDKLQKMKHHYAESELYNPQMNFKKEELKRMEKLEILKNISKQEQIQNLIEVANNYNRKIPISSLNLKFRTKQQFFTFDDPTEKQQIMRLYNLRDNISKQAKKSMSQQSLSSQYQQMVTKKTKFLPKETYLYLTNYNQKQNKKVKKQQREMELPRNLVTNNIMSLQRQEFLERTLNLKNNLVREIRENTQKLHKKLDNIYFEDVDVVKQNKEDQKQVEGNSDKKINKKQQESNSYKNKINDMNQFINQNSKDQINIVEYLDQNKDLSLLLGAQEQENLQENNDDDYIPAQESSQMINSYEREFLNNNKNQSTQNLKRHFLYSTHLKQLKKDDNFLFSNNNNSVLEFRNQKTKPKSKVESKLINKEKALPQHTLVRKKQLSILKYNL